MGDLLLRSFDGELGWEGRHLVGLFVPFDRPAAVVDKGQAYREGFRRGAFGHYTDPKPGQLQAITFRHTHEGGIGHLGHLVGLAERADGLYGEVSVLRDRKPTVEDLLEDGVSALSVGFYAVRSAQEDDVVWRTDVRLHHVALEARGAYPEAKVLALRAEADDTAAHQAEVSDHLNWLAAAVMRQQEYAARVSYSPPDN